jgi:hypothetical protein
MKTIYIVSLMKDEEITKEYYNAHHYFDAKNSG